MSGSLDWDHIFEFSGVLAHPSISIHHKNVPSEIIKISTQILKTQLKNSKKLSQNHKGIKQNIRKNFLEFLSWVFEIWVEILIISEGTFLWWMDIEGWAKTPENSKIWSQSSDPLIIKNYWKFGNIE